MRLLTKEIVIPRELRGHIGPENTLSNFTSTRRSDNMWETTYSVIPTPPKEYSNTITNFKPIISEPEPIISTIYDQMIYLMEQE